jgi:hypothetical protein
MKSEVSWDELHSAIEVNPHKSSLGLGAASSSLSTLPEDKALQWLPGWTEDHSASLPDCVSLSLWIRDPLYRSATQSVRGLMEMEEASFLLNNIDIAWKEQHGRVHGWVRKHLEEDLRARSSGAPAPIDAWELVRNQKRHAQLVDYICTMRKFRVGLWWPEQKLVTTIPAQPFTDTLVNIQCQTNRVLVGPDGFWTPLSSWPTLLIRSDMEWFIPACVTFGNQTVSQIVEQLQTIKPGVYKGNRNSLWTRLNYERSIKIYSDLVA